MPCNYSQKLLPPPLKTSETYRKQKLSSDASNFTINGNFPCSNETENFLEVFEQLKSFLVQRLHFHLRPIHRTTRKSARTSLLSWSAVIKFKITARLLTQRTNERHFHLQVNCTITMHSFLIATRRPTSYHECDPQVLQAPFSMTSLASKSINLVNKLASSVRVNRILIWQFIYFHNRLVLNFFSECFLRLFLARRDEKLFQFVFVLFLYELLFGCCLG